MTLPPNTTPRPLPFSPAPPTSSAMPPPPPPPKDSGPSDFPLPKLRLEVRDVGHAGTNLFFSSVNAHNCMTKAVRNVLGLLYTSPSHPETHAPPTRSVTLILRDMDGVAYTTGSDLDNDHKEIHFSLRYINGIPKDRARSEIWGVVTHELVHCYQHDGKGTCPSGLIEGIADWVRLRCDLSPPHWKRETDGNWDGGYQKTGYFLDHLEGKYGKGTVQRLNEKLRCDKYEADRFWQELFGKDVADLWKEYGSTTKA